MRDQTALWKGYAGRRYVEPMQEPKPAQTYNGDAVWEDPRKFAASLTDCDLGSEKYLNGAGIPLMCDGKHVYVDATDSHTLILGSTGSMKSRLMCMPGLEMMARAGESVVVADPKGELFEKVGGSFIEKGYDVCVINLRDPSCGSRWNPFQYPLELYRKGDVEAANDLVLDLSFDLVSIENTKDPYWESSAQMLLYGMAWHQITDAKGDEQVTLKDVHEEVLEVVGSQTTRRYMSRPECAGIKNVINLPDGTRNCVLGVFNQKLWNLVSHKSMVDLMSVSDVDLVSVGDRKTAIFLIVPDEKNTYNMMVSIFIKQLYSALINRAHEHKGGTLPVRVNFLLDEFANFPRIPNMQSMITASRSRNIRFTLVVQTEKQLCAVYGGEAKAIRDNCSNWVFLTGRDLDFLKELSELIGCGADGKPLITVSGLQRLERKTALVLAGRRNPIITRLTDIDDYGLEYEAPVLEPRPPMEEPKVKKKESSDSDDDSVDFSELFG